jgi:hypothetical protein
MQNRSCRHFENADQWGWGLGAKGVLKGSWVGASEIKTLVTNNISLHGGV